MSGQRRCDPPDCERDAAVFLYVNGGLWVALCKQCWFEGCTIMIGGRVHFKYAQVEQGSECDCSGFRCTSPAVHVLTVDGEDYGLCHAHYKNGATVVTESGEEFMISGIP